VIVADASVVVAALADDEADGARARQHLREDPDVHAPHLLDVEVAAVLRRLAVVEQALTDARVGVALEGLRDLPVVRYPHTVLIGRAWELRHNVRPYDGVYVALAEALDATLVTRDRRLCTASGIRCPVELL
jgi:predicted nucleic acid-binding protein